MLGSRQCGSCDAGPTLTLDGPVALATKHSSRSAFRYPRLSEHRS